MIDRHPNTISFSTFIFYFSTLCTLFTISDAAQCNVCPPPPPNPCSVGSPMRTPTGNVFTCNWKSGPTACGQGFWCHVGVTIITTCCCQQLVTNNPCDMPVESGVGVGAVQRWYFDTSAKKCKPFLYRGLKGNQNNFMSVEHCRSTCPEAINPCCCGDPAELPDGSRHQCRISGSTEGCPASFWCHVGATAETTACCPGAANSCNAPMVVGLGVSTLQRWYYDARNLQCKQFTYAGLQGTQNNYMSKQQCEATCDVWETPCPDFRTPDGRDANTQRIFCRANSRTCPLGFWCHVGANDMNTVCCAGAMPLPAPCSLPQATGRGLAQLTRWFMDTSKGPCPQCTQFIYTGTKGNQNNFLSLRECEMACPTCINACVDGPPATSPDGRVVMCTATSGHSICPVGHWCHVGADQRSTMCCPNRSAQPCAMPQIGGSGNSNLQRWYLDPSAGLCGRCRQFTYSGLMGNQNNFQTQMQCQQSCPSCLNPCSQGQPIINPNTRRPRTCNPSNICPSTHWCHVGATTETTTCCPSMGDVCTLPVMPGTGMANLQRWFYNAEKRTCDSFIYGGMMGSQNMFLSKSDCEAIGCPLWRNACAIGDPILDGVRPRVCSPANQCSGGYYCHIGAPGSDLTQCCQAASPDACSQPRVAGFGEFNANRFYYDPVRRLCLPFTYKGMRGNMNNFLTQQDCEATCPVFQSVCPRGDPLLSGNRPAICSQNQRCPQSGYYCHIGATPETTQCCAPNSDPCTTPMSRGEGNANLQRWYYDPQRLTCTTFTFGGIRGNTNNFITQQSCREACPEVNPCANGTPLQVGGRPVRCNGEDSQCPRTHFCHRGVIDSPEFSTVICCPLIGDGDPCAQPKTDGRPYGGLTDQRYFYDKLTDECVPFTFMGIRGNQNNFFTQEQCETACPGYRGLCPHGRPLLLLTVPQVCDVENACPRGNVCNVQGQSVQDQSGVCCPDPADFCYEPRDPGNGNGSETRYGYDPATNTCTGYQYTGSGGSRNNFRDLQKCTEICCNEFQVNRKSNQQAVRRMLVDSKGSRIE